MDYDADVIIIGAGGGGAVAAKELGQKGLKVLLLEAGPWYGNKKWPNPNLDYEDTGSSSFDDLSIEILKSNFTDLEDDMNNFVYGKLRWGPSNRDAGPWPRKLEGQGFIWQSSGVGGTTLQYYANSPRAYTEAVNNVWPISYSELVPYYERIEADLPVAAAPTTAKEQLFYYGAEQAGWELLDSPDVDTPGYRPQPNAILRPNMSAPAENLQNIQTVGCTLRGHCVNGCHIGPTVAGVAKRSTLVSSIPDALGTGNVEVRPNAFVTRILTEGSNEQGIHASGVIYRNTWSGQTTELRAKVIVMAAGGIESPRLWLNSDLPQNEWVGKGLTNHWFDCLAGIFEENILMDILGVSEIQPYVGQNSAARFDYPGLGVIQTFGMSPGLYSNWLYASSSKGNSFMNNTVNQPWDFEGNAAGRQLKDFMRQYTRTLGLLIFTDDTVVETNTITVDPEVKDENGYIPVINYKPIAADMERREQLAVIAADILRKAGAKTIIRSNMSKDIFIHIMSTMRMGYVTDINCEALQVQGLYIADNSVLYNGLGGPNPTLTTQALAIRTSEKIKEKYFPER